MNNDIQQEINKIIDKHRFRTFNKIIAVIRKDQRFNDVDDKVIRNIIQQRIHDKRPSRNYKQIYQVTIFSRFRNAYFTDLYDNLEGNDPRYWQIFINTNTRYGVALPLKRINTREFKNVCPRISPKKVNER